MRESVAALAAGVVLTLSPVPLGATPAQASTPARPVPARTGCTGLTGAAAMLFNQTDLCRSLSRELLRGRTDDLGNVLRDSMRGVPSLRHMHHSEARHRFFTSHQRPPARLPERPRRHPSPARNDPDRRSPGSLPRGITRPKATPSHGTPSPSAPPGTPRPPARVRAVPPEADRPQSFGMLSILMAGLVMLGVVLLHRRSLPALASAVRGPLRPARRDGTHGVELVRPYVPPPAAPPADDHPLPPVPFGPERPEAACTAVQVAAELARPSGVGLVGDGVDGFVRAVVTELVTRDGPRARVVLSRTELDRLYGGAFDEPLRSALEPELRVCELLEDAIEHLELEILVSDAEQANPDLSPTRGRGMPTIYWIATPGHDDDVVLPLVRRGPAHRPVGVMFGVWTHGRTCSVDADGTLTAPSGPRRVPLLTMDESLAALRAHASTERTGWL
ncbi:hypothetical protein [Actinomadura harenae]|uniref:Uncharacterized protein n=1 Tax=Actinomadura harenae TaxID=2483351 RepID=A0A3M2MB05_9ACTN|nr:hypothetical protein [Actinomadura harenae]RMI46807.1 hypothetical protein EBO15_05570 [Actinomadura harenae]